MEYETGKDFYEHSLRTSRADWASTTVCPSDDESDEDKRNESSVGDKKYKSLMETNTVEEPGKYSTDILQAAQKNEVDVVRGMLEKNPSLINVNDCDSYTPLHRACYNNHVEVIKVLLSYGANVSAKTCDDREPLHCACQWDCVEAASILLQNGADINALTSGKLSPLHLASANSKARRTLELLLWHPYIDSTLKSDGNDLAYDTARRSSPYAALFEILEASVNVY